MREAIYILLPPLFIIAGYTEVKERRIPNWLTYSVAVCALCASLVVCGMEGLKSSGMGLLLGAGAFLPFCLAGAVGGGDFKMMGAVGAVIGYPMVLWGLYYTVLAGGALALFYAIWHGRLLSTLAEVARMLLGRGRGGKEGEGLRKVPTLPFGLAIAIGTIWAIVARNMDL